MLKLLELIKSAPDYDYSGVQPFVFKPTGEPISNIPPDHGVIASPFPFFSIEIDGGALTSDDAIDAFKQGFDTRLQAIVCREIAPDNYDLLCLTVLSDPISGNPITSKVIHSTKEINPKMYNLMVSLVQVHLQRLNNEHMGEISIRARAKYRHKGKKAFYRPTNTIYIQPKAVNQATRTANGTIVRVSPSWAVRGHWRRLANPSTMGQDRQGARLVRGYTWIKAHVKGEHKELPPTTKTRIVK